MAAGDVCRPVRAAVACGAVGYRRNAFWLDDSSVFVLLLSFSDLLILFFIL